MDSYFKNEKKIKPNGVFLVILCAIVGYVVTFAVINTHLVGNPNPNRLTSLRLAIGPDSADLKIIPHDSVLYNGDTIRPSARFVRAGSSSLFNRNPTFILWAQLIIIMVSIASGAFPVFIWQLIAIKKLFAISTNQFVKKIVYAFAVCAFTLGCNSFVKELYTPIDLIKDFTILISPWYIVQNIVTATLLLLVPIVAVIFLMVPASMKIPESPASKLEFEKSAYLIDRLNKALASALQVLAIIVVFSVLTSSALSESIKATLTVKGFEVFPTQACYVYGLLFASFLGIVYIPIQVFLKQRSESLKESLIFFNNSLEQKDDKWFERVYAVVNINSSSLDNLKQAFTVLAPLLSSFLPEIFKLISSK